MSAIGFIADIIIISRGNDMHSRSILLQQLYSFSWRRAASIIERRVTKIEQNLHHCALLCSQRGSNGSIVNPCPSFLYWSWESKHLSQKGPEAKGQRESLGCETRPGGPDDLCETLLCQGHSWQILRPPRRPASALLSVGPPAATRADTSHYLLIASLSSS